MKKSSWEFIEDFYETFLGVPKKVTNLLSIESIVKGCAMGLSNSRMSKKYSIDEYMIELILEEEVGFIGWSNDLDFSPLAIYNRNEGNFLAYEQEILTISPFNFENKTKLSFNICKKYEDIKKEIDKYYE